MHDQPFRRSVSSFNCSSSALPFPLLPRFPSASLVLSLCSHRQFRTSFQFSLSFVLRAISIRSFSALHKRRFYLSSILLVSRCTPCLSRWLFSPSFSTLPVLRIIAVALRPSCIASTSLVFSRLPEVVLRSRYILRSLRHNRRCPSFSFPCSVVISISRSLHVSGSPAAHPHCFARPYFSFS